MLSGIKILFSGVVDSKMKRPAEQCRAWRVALALGAEVLQECGPQVLAQQAWG